MGRLNATSRRLGLLGGSFNPPHNGHVAVARRAVAALGLDSLIIMPASAPVHKELPPETPSREHRMTMARLAFEDIPNCRVSDWEMNRPSPTYTVDTLEHLRAEGQCLTVIVGSDMFLTMHEWMRAEDLFAIARVAVFLRDDAGSVIDVNRDNLSRHAAFLAHRHGASVDFIEHVPIVISSTRLRGLLRTGEGGEFLPQAVYRHIATHGLYGMVT